MLRFPGFVRKFDWYLAVAVFALILMGLAAIYSVALSQEGADFLFVKKQVIALVIGGALFLFLAFSNYRLLRSYGVILYILGLLLLIAVLFFGSTVRGTTGWFSMAGFSFQPVEIMKVFLIIILARYFAQRSRVHIGWREIIISGLITAVPMFLVLLQPDLGSALVLLVIWGSLLIFAKVKLRDLLILSVGGGLSFLAAWTFLFADYQKARLLTFFNPANDPLGEGYNVAQAIIAIGSGGWFGRGLGFGSQSQLKFLPESQTDFIFAVIAEELGFFGVLLVISGFCLVFWRLLRLVKYSADDFASFLLLGIGSVLFFQFVVNAGMNLGLMPVTGIALPFLSYGGSALLMTLILLGIAESIALRTSTTRALS